MKTIRSNGQVYRVCIRNSGRDGTVRELVSRNLMRLQAEGLVEVEARNITVPDLPGLTAIFDGNS